MTVEKWELMLFVAGDSVGIKQLYREVGQMCEDHISGGYSIELVNIMDMPEKAYEFDIIATPTLLRRKPPPKRKVVGNLAPASKVLACLGLHI